MRRTGTTTPRRRWMGGGAAIAVASLAASSLTAAGALPAGRWTMAVLPVSGKVVCALDVNEHGAIAGGIKDPEDHAFLLDGSQVTDLGDLGGGTAFALALNDSGVVVGDSTTTGFGSGTHGFRWTASGGMVDLGTLGGATSHALAINDHGVIAGQAATATGELHAVIWDPDTGIHDLGVGGGTSAEARAVNASGTIAGNVSTSGGTRGALWASATTSPTILEPLSGPTGIGTVTVRGINAAGTVVGSTSIPDGSIHAMRWTPAGGMVDLGTMGMVSSEAEGINDAGTVVGSATDSQKVQVPVVVDPESGMAPLPMTGVEGAAGAISDANIAVGCMTDIPYTHTAGVSWSFSADPPATTTTTTTTAPTSTTTSTSAPPVTSPLAQAVSGSPAFTG